MTTQLRNINYSRALLYGDWKRNPYRIVCRNRWLLWLVLHCFVLKVRAAVSSQWTSLTTEFEWLKRNEHLPWSSNSKIAVSMVSKLPFCIWTRNTFHCLCCLKNVPFLKSVQCIESYGHLNVRCWKLWIHIFSSEKPPKLPLTNIGWICRLGIWFSPILFSFE